MPVKMLCLLLVAILAAACAPQPKPETSTLMPLAGTYPATFTPRPTLPTSTALPTLTIPPSSQGQDFATATLVILPTSTSRLVTRGATLTIAGVDKLNEFVDIQNIGIGTVNLRGWTLVSERGRQVCALNGILQPREVLRVWAGTSNTGYSCGFRRDIWNDNELDPAVLINPQGDEISRFPKP